MTVPTQPPKNRSVKQIIGVDGSPSKAVVTSNLWVSDPGRFSDKTEGNRIKAFTTGRAYYADLVTEISNAKTQILMAGWQIGWDALLTPGLRLYDALFQAAQKAPALKIYVMPWDDHEPVQTYDDEVKAALEVINDKLGRTQVFVQLSPTYADTNGAYYAHHQKQVVIDGKIAYVGGMDVTYGRFCDEHYTLHANADGRDGMNRYNGCIAPVGEMDSAKLVDPDLLTGPWDRAVNARTVRDRIHAGGLQPKYKTAWKLESGVNASSAAANPVDQTTIDPMRQPRMPWQDVHCRIEGPAVSDLMRNFILRWNVEAAVDRRLPPAPAPSSLAPAGSAHIQVLRSAPANHCKKEFDAIKAKGGIARPKGTQTDILSAMLTLIDKSRRFIYIENQFFVSAFGREAPLADSLSPAAQFIDAYGKNHQNAWATLASDANSQSRARPALHVRKGKGILPNMSWNLFDRTAAIAPPTNGIVPALLARIRRSALSNSPFHVYLTLPVHPEGCLSDATVAVQVYWTMQTISFGSQSLLNGIRRIIKARELRDAKDENFARVFEDGNSEHEDIDVSRCEEFVTILNLRNWVQLGNSIVTEQIYVHSKTMIVDDQYAIIGSANINDRSLLGERDSELAVLVMDEETLHADVNGTGSNRIVRKFAHQLRIDLWNKIFGFTDKTRPAAELQKAVEQPGAKNSWKLIQQRAEKNARCFEAAFNWIPRSSTGPAEAKEPGHILPTWRNALPAPAGAPWGTSGNVSAPLPFQEVFWETARHEPDANAQLAQVKGFITAFPVGWIKGENLRFEYPTALVADNDMRLDNPAGASQSEESELAPG
jgi:phospholipase D1/2